MNHRIFMPGARRGLTLLELLVALGLAGVVIAAVAAALASGISVWGAARTFDTRRMQALLCLEEIERDVRNSFSFYGLHFSGDRKSLRFPVIAAMEAGGSQSVRTITEVGYWFKEADGSLWRYRHEWPSALGPHDAGKEQVLADLGAISFRYGEWTGEQNRRLEWRNSWTGKDGEMPACVRMDLVVGRDDKPVVLRRTVYLPVECMVKDDKNKQ